MLQNKNMYLCNQLFFSCVKMLLLDVSGKTWQKKAYAELGKKHVDNGMPDKAIIGCNHKELLNIERRLRGARSWHSET